MKKWIFVLLTFTAMPAFSDLQTDMMADRLDRLDREMTLLQKKVYTQLSDKETNRRTDSVASGNLGDVYTQLEDQNHLISDLTRRVEELSHEQAVLKEQLRLLNADIDIRFQEKTKPLPPEPKPANLSKKSDKEAYDSAYNLLMKTKYAEAEKAFQNFLKDYPDSSFVGNANYWLGETYYVRGQYDVAASVFSDGLTKYEKSSKAPDNLLKLGLTMTQLGKKEEACGFFKLMTEKYPKAGITLRQRAEQEAKKLSCL